jgi:transposase-like protein
MLDGLEIAGRVHVVALGITTEGVKVPLGLWEGSTENATLARSLLSDLVDRGLDPGQGILFVLDGGKALRRAIREVFGEHALVHRCHRHKERNILDLLPERDRRRSSPGSGGRGRCRTPRRPRPSSSGSPPSWTGHGPTRARRCAKA